MPGFLTRTRPVAYTEFQSQQHSANVINQANHDALEAISRAIRTAEEYVWENPFGLTPQQVFDSYGLNAGALHMQKLQMKAVVNAEQPNAIPDNPNDSKVTINPNGTVTVSA